MKEQTSGSKPVVVPIKSFRQSGEDTGVYKESSLKFTSDQYNKFSSNGLKERNINIKKIEIEKKFENRDERKPEGRFKVSNNKIRNAKEMSVRKILNIQQNKGNNQYTNNNNIQNQTCQYIAPVFKKIDINANTIGKHVMPGQSSDFRSDRGSKIKSTLMLVPPVIKNDPNKNSGSNNNNQSLSHNSISVQTCLPQDKDKAKDPNYLNKTSSSFFKCMPVFPKDTFKSLNPAMDSSLPKYPLAFSKCIPDIIPDTDKGLNTSSSDYTSRYSNLHYCFRLPSPSQMLPLTSSRNDLLIFSDFRKKNKSLLKENIIDKIKSSKIPDLRRLIKKKSPIGNFNRPANSILRNNKNNSSLIMDQEGNESSDIEFNYFLYENRNKQKMVNKSSIKTGSFIAEGNKSMYGKGFAPLQAQSKKESEVIKNCFAKTKAGIIQDGTKKINQDSYLIKQKLLGLENFSMFAILDGHGSHGHYISNFVKNQLISYFSNKGLYSSKFASEFFTEDYIYNKLKANDFEIIKNSYTLIEANLTKTSYELNTSGSTATLVLIIGNKLICANAGDSRGILVQERTEDNKEIRKAIQISNDHRACYKDEGRVGSIEKASEYGLAMGTYRVWLRNEKGQGFASVTRSIGDMNAKKMGVLTEPEINEYDLTPESKFFVIASDGIWECLSNKKVMNIVNKYYKINNVQMASDRLIEEATKCWRLGDLIVDDITVVIGFL